MKRIVLGSLAALIVAGSMLASVVSANPNATKQRISILGKLGTGSGPTFQLIPLTKGPLKRDSGTFLANGQINGPVISNGQRVKTILGYDDLTGYQGTFKMSQSVESVAIGGGYTVDTGTWSLQGLTGAYAGLTGEGRFAAVGFPSGKLLSRQEGWVTKP